MGVADRGGVEVFARQVPFSSDLLAALEAMGRAGYMARCLANTAGRAGWRRPAEVGGDVPGRQLRPGEKGGSAVGKTKRGKGTKWMVLVDGGGLPLGVRLESASPAEVTLAEATLAEVKVPRAKGRPRQKPKRVIADRAYSSGVTRRLLRSRKITTVIPQKRDEIAARKRRGTAGGRPPALDEIRYKRKKK